MSGWEELRREIEALADPYAGWVPVAAVLAIVDRLAAARGEPEIAECGWTGVYGWFNDAPATQPCNLPDWHEGRHERHD